MKTVLLTGATGYIGKRILPLLAQKYDRVVCCTRDRDRMAVPKAIAQTVELVEVDFLDADTLDNIPTDIDGAYYLMHSMSSSQADFMALELQVAENFRRRLDQTQCRHVVYLSGIVNGDELSRHLSSRLAVETELHRGNYAVTTLRAGIIIGSGSASFEIIRDLVEKLPVMVAPRWVHTRCQPIAIRDVLTFLARTLFDERLYDQNFDIGGRDVLSYLEMLKGYAEARDLNRWILPLPVMTPRLSSYWLFFVTSTTYPLAVSLVDSMTVEVVARDNRLAELLDIEPHGYREALNMAFAKIEQNAIVSSWKDSLISGRLGEDISEFVNVPTHGCFVDRKERPVLDRRRSIERIWSIGGKIGWYYGDFLWKLRGYIDKLWGGVGLRRGRTHPHHIEAGDVIDFWRVIYADKTEGKLLLYAEMKLPGDAWLEFKVGETDIVQTATFRPVGLLGRLYWYAVLPFHGFIFNGMIDQIQRGD